ADVVVERRGSDVLVLAHRSSQRSATSSPSMLASAIIFCAALPSPWPCLADVVVERRGSDVLVLAHRSSQRSATSSPSMLASAIIFCAALPSPWPCLARALLSLSRMPHCSPSMVGTSPPSTTRPSLRTTADLTGAFGSAGR